MRHAVVPAGAAAALSAGLILSGYLEARNAEIRGLYEDAPVLLMTAAAGGLVAVVLIVTGVLMMYLGLDKKVARHALGAGSGYLLGVPVGIVVAVAGRGWLW